MSNINFEDYGLTIDKFCQLMKDIDENDETMEFINDLGKLSSNYKDEFNEKLRFFHSIYKGSCLNNVDKSEDNKIKGKALEELVKLTFESAGGLFTCFENLHTGTNEIDILVKGTARFKSFPNHLNSRFNKIICECKNHSKTINVGYVGKFYSLVRCSQLSISIMFSHDGLAGTGKWNSSKGLVRKIYLLNSNKEKAIYVLDFNYNDFIKYSEGSSLIDILDSKCEELELDVNFSDYIKKHPNEDMLISKITSIISE
jgi:hypothetical protein